MSGTPVPRPTRGAVFLAVGVTAAVIVVLLAAWRAAEALLLIFGAVLLAILFRSAARALGRVTRLSEGWSLAAVLVGFFAVLGGGGVWMAPTVSEQYDQFLTRLPEAADRIEQVLDRLGFGAGTLTGAEGVLAQLNDPEEITERAAAALGWITRIVGSLLVLLFIGIYFAAQPDLYTRGLVRLVPPDGRARATQLVDEVAHTLRWWLITRVVSMAAVGILTTIMLALLGVPLAILLGLQAFLLTFVPYIGPIAATVPIALVALIEGPQTLLWAVLLYTLIQSVEGFLIMPLAQERLVFMPPALALVAEVLMGLWFGLLGVVFATPLAAALLPVARRLYLEDTLHEGERVRAGPFERSERQPPAISRRR